MPIQYTNPVFFGIMVAVALGTAIFSYLSTPSVQKNEYKNKGGNAVRGKQIGRFADLGTRLDNGRRHEQFSPRPTDKEKEKRRSSRRASKNECPICLEFLKEPLKALACMHTFHENCITEWLVGNNTCPICRHQST